MWGGYWTYAQNVWAADRRSVNLWPSVHYRYRKKTAMPIDREADAKQWRVTLFGFPLKGNLVFLRISLRNPLFTDGNHGAVKTELCNSAAWFQLKHWISKTITPILMCIFYVFPVYFAGKFVGGALANWYGKLAPVVDQCFESQKHWIFAFFSCEKEPGFIPKTIPDWIWHVRLSGTIQLHGGWLFFFFF